MTDEQRFPPPCNEVGYREAAPLVDAPPQAVTSDKKKHVLARLAEPPEVARNHAAIEDTASADALRRAELAASVRRNQRRRVMGTFIVVTMLASAFVVTRILRWRSDGLIEAKRQVELGRAAKFVCMADADCVNSCTNGAVNRYWLASQSKPDCEDGCANQLARSPRCILSECVAFEADPQTRETRRNDRCTKR